MIAIDLNLQVWTPRSICEPAMKAFVLLKNEIAAPLQGSALFRKSSRYLNLGVAKGAKTSV